MSKTQSHLHANAQHSTRPVFPTLTVPALRSVSDQHAELEMDLGHSPPRILLRDLGSRNATFVNEVQVCAHACAWASCEYSKG